MTRDNCILLGTIAKTHGVRGELIIRTANHSFDFKEDWESIFLLIDGILVPFFISSLREFKSGEWVVKFDWYEGRNEAESLIGLPVWVPAGQVELREEEVTLDDLIGFEFLDSQSKQTGTLVEFLDIPENPLFEVEVSGKKILIPAREEFIVEVNTLRKSITFNLPEGLL